MLVTLPSAAEICHRAIQDGDFAAGPSSLHGLRV